jgi:hypothetical protein
MMNALSLPYRQLNVVPPVSVQSRQPNVHDDDRDQDGWRQPNTNTGKGKLSLVIRGEVSVVESVWCNDHRVHTKSEKDLTN